MIKILHHSGDISPELSAFFHKHGLTVLPLIEYEAGLEISHILVSGEQDFNLLGNMFDTMANDVAMVALSEVRELADFVRNNGRLVFDQSWLASPMGLVNVEKFFLGQASVHLDENFPSVKEGASFKVTNHLRIGLELDRLSAFVHARDGAVVNVRTFVDHAFYYLVYLKQAGIGSLPIDVDYGHTGKEMVVQIHLSVRNYVGEYLIDSFGQPSGQDPIRYLLSVCAHSADFMEVQYIENASKLVISGLWQDRSSMSTQRFSGILINKVQTSRQIERQIDLDMKRLTLISPSDEKDAAEVLNGKPLPDQLQRIDEDLFPESFDAAAPEEEFVQTIKGGPQEEEFSQVVKGSTEDKEFSQVVKGSAAEEEFVQKISGSKEEEVSKQVIKGERAKKDDFVTRISSSPEEKSKANWEVKSTGTEATSDRIRGHLQRYATSLGQSVDSLGAEELHSFTVKELPGLLAESQAKDNTSDAKQAAMLMRLRTLEAEKVKTKAQLDTAQTEIRILKEARDQMAQIERKAKEAVSLAPTVTAEDVMTLEQKMQLMQSLANGRSDPAAEEKMKKILEREQKVIQAARLAETEVRKAKLEMQQKEAFFTQEIEKANRDVKTRDLVVQKAKEGLSVIVAKKDHEIHELKTKVTALLTSQGAALQAGGQQKIKELEQEKQSLSRLVEVYKNKIASMAANLEKQVAGGNPKKDEDVRKITMEKQRAEVALQALQKELAKQKSKSELDQSELLRLRGEKTKLEESLRQAMSSAGPTNAASSARTEAQTTKIRELQHELSQQTQKTGKADAQVKDLEHKVLELTAAMAKAPTPQADGAMKSKLTQMEASVKKLSSDFAAATNQLGEAKKEINKLRSENTALKNMADKAKKDAEKASKAKPGAPDKKAS